MFIQKVKTEGLAHLSYVVGSQGEAVVIDPRRDCDIYIDIANDNDCKIVNIFETHRNEDLVSGAAALSQMTNAAVYHGPNAAESITYATTTYEGDEFSFGKLLLRVLETPGHTDDSLSFVVIDCDYSDHAFGVFTGDALFVGDVGRVDFYPDRAEEVAGLLFDSLRKLEKLGDQTIIYPAHGAGSVCGSGMAEREESTIGFECINNALFKNHNRNEFIEKKINEYHYYPPYFRCMEKINITGAQPDTRTLSPVPLKISDINNLSSSTTIIDVRSASAFLGAHLTNSLSIPLDLIGSYAGWLVDPSKELVIIADNNIQAKQAVRHLARIGLDNVIGYLAPSLTSWAAAGGDFGTIHVINSTEVHERIENKPKYWTLIDVRKKDEVINMSIPESTHIYLGELPNKLEDLNLKNRYTVMCGSGARATVGASILLQAGFDKVDLFFGSIGAWLSHGYVTV